MEQLDIETIDPDGPLHLPLGAMPTEGYASKAHYRYAGSEQVHEVIVVRVNEELFALDSRCPHAGGRLAEGPLLDGENVHCPLHLYRFRPSDGESLGIDCSPATTFPIHVEDQRVRIDVGPASD